jgi:6-pyruvoyl-tetrahydropterin synthase
MIKVIKYYELNRISRVLVTAIITYIIGILIKREYEESKTVYNFVDLQMKYKNYILVNKERSITNDKEYKFTLRNPITNQNSTVYVKYYLYHHVYFVGDTIK